MAAVTVRALGKNYNSGQKVGAILITCVLPQEAELKKDAERLSKWKTERLNSLLDLLDLPRGKDDAGTRVCLTASSCLAAHLHLADKFALLLLLLVA